MIDKIKFLTTYLIPEYCHDEFFLKFNFTHVECLKIAISKCLGIGIIAGSALVKIPQIVKLFQAKSAVGINIVSVLLELLAVTANTAYSYANDFPFSAWGEGLFLVIQTSCIAFLVLLYGGNVTYAYAFLAIYNSILYVLIGGIAPMNFLWFLQTLVLPIIISSKSIQSLENFRNGHTGQLSAITSFMLLAGSLARIFTSIQETGDNLIILMYIINTISNSVLFAQILYYWNATIIILKEKCKANTKTD